MNDKLLSRFLKFIQIDSQSDEQSNSRPSTDKQLHFAGILAEELKSIGLFDIRLDRNGYVYAGLPSNTSSDHPVIGLIAHMDTSPDFTAENVKPRIHYRYDGKDIPLDSSGKTVLSPAEFPELKKYIGQTLITTSGDSLLGADDKAGIAIIISALEYLMEHPDIKHGEVRIAFTPDEEIGRGADGFDVKGFGADYAYTIDGGELGELEYENFNAALATIKIHGRNVHPGSAKGKMINSLLLAGEFNLLLPQKERPETTEGYEGFFHLIDVSGKVEETTMRYLIRDHSAEKFSEKKKLLSVLSDKIQKKYPGARIEVKIKDQYFNMKEKIIPMMHIIEKAGKAMLEAGVEPLVKPIRGGTDGSRLSFMGLPSPNLFTGGHNFHGRFEFIPLESMQKSVEVIVNILRIR